MYWKVLTVNLLYALMKKHFKYLLEINKLHKSKAHYFFSELFIMFPHWFMNVFSNFDLYLSSSLLWCKNALVHIYRHVCTLIIVMSTHTVTLSTVRKLCPQSSIHSQHSYS